MPSGLCLSEHYLSCLSIYSSVCISMTAFLCYKLKTRHLFSHYLLDTKFIISFIFSVPPSICLFYSVYHSPLSASLQYAHFFLSVSFPRSLFILLYLKLSFYLCLLLCLPLSHLTHSLPVFFPPCPIALTVYLHTT